jgi:hypothetical protein
MATTSEFLVCVHFERPTWRKRYLSREITRTERADGMSDKQTPKIYFNESLRKLYIGKIMTSGDM